MSELRLLRRSEGYETCADVGQDLGQREIPKNEVTEKVHKSKINPLKSCNFSGFLVAAAGLEPATSGL